MPSWFMTFHCYELEFFLKITSDFFERSVIIQHSSTVYSAELLGLFFTP